jgi:hydroxymethylpyrimidine/phosphomethylpyrimidine kinase
VQDNNRVHEVAPVDAAVLTRQASLLAQSVRIDAVKLGIPGNRANAEAIAAIIAQLRARQPGLPVVLDPVLASGHGDALARGNARDALAPLLALATVVAPNLGEAAALGSISCPHVLVTGGHGEGAEVVNVWHGPDGQRSWRWPRLPDGRRA